MTSRRSQPKRRVVLIEDPTLPPHVEALWSHTWFVAHTRPNQEWFALEDIERAGFAAYLPVSVGWQNTRYLTRRAIERPLLIRYVFVGLPSRGSRPRPLSDDERARLRACYGVTDLVAGASFRPLHVPIENLVALAGQQTEGAFDATRDDVFTKGETLQITSGPLAGFQATAGDTVASSISPEDAVAVLVKLLGKETLVHVPLADLRKTV